MYVLTSRPCSKSLAPLGRRTLALVICAAAVANVASLLVAHPLVRAVSFERMTGLNLWELGRAGVLLGAVLLLFVARALLRGKRQAWRLALGLASVALLGILFNHRQWGYALAAPGLLTLLLILAPLFPARSDRWAALRGYTALVLCLTLSASSPLF